MSLPSTIKQMRELSPEEVTSGLANLEKEIFHQRFKKSLHQLEGAYNMRQLRHQYAQLKTVAAERR